MMHRKIGKQAKTFMLCTMMTPAALAQTETAGNKILASQPQSIETIVVTGELLKRPVSESANSVEILDEDDLARRAGLVTLRDALNSVSNISLVTGTGKAPTVRGVDGTGPAENANAFFAGSRPRLSWRIDGRPASYNEVVFGDLGLFDVARVEVLRGPQSTLVGRNAIAGTVVVKTNDPTFEQEGLFRLVGGNYDQQQVSGMVNLPVTDDRVAVRLSADWLQKESAVSYTAFTGIDNPGAIEAKSLQGKLLFIPDDERESRLLLTLSHREYSGPNGEIVVYPFEDRNSNFPQQPRHEPKYTSLAADYSLPLNSDWQFQLNTSATDFNFTRTAVPNTSSATVDTSEYTLEPQLRYKKDGVQAVTGLYYYRARQDEFIEFLGGQNFDDQADTVAAYAEGIISLTDSVDLSLGLRYEQEDRLREGGDATGTLVKIFADKTYDALLPKLGVNWRASANSNWGAQIAKGYNAGGGGIAFSFPIVNYEFKEETAWTYELYGRQQIANGRIRTTQNLFYSRYQDMQLPFDLTPNDSRDEAFVVRNADAVETRGLELGIAATVTGGLEIWGNIAWLDTEVIDYPNSGIEGNQLLTAPNFTANLGVAWQINNWHLSLSSRHSDSYFTDVNNRHGGKTDPYAVVDTQLSYEIANVRWFVTGKNLFDSDKPVARYPGLAPTGSTSPDSAFDSAVLLQPRSVLAGVQLKY